MNKTYLLAIAAALVAAPMAFAHTDGGVYGTPKTYCENLAGDQNVHDYAVNGATGVVYLLSFFMDGNTQDCDGDGQPGDFDGHAEWSTGGAWLLSSDAGAPVSGATTCFGEGPHHGAHPQVWVFDHVWPTGVTFVVGVDTSSLPIFDPTTGLTTDCGDGVDDFDTGYCIDHCTVGFAPGRDGAYHVYVVNNHSIAGTVHVIYWQPGWPPFESQYMICQRDLLYFNDHNPNEERWICVDWLVLTSPSFAAAGHVYT